MEEACSSEMFVTVYQTKGYPIPENMNLDQHCFQNLKMHTDFVASIIIPVFLTPPPPIISILWHPSSYKNRNVETMRNKHNYCTPNLNLWNQNTNEGSLKICWAFRLQRTLLPPSSGQKSDDQLKAATSYKMLVPFYPTNIAVNLLAHLRCT